MASLTNKEIADLHRQCMVELREGGSEATQKMLEFWGIQDYLHTDEFFHRVQLMLEQESYYERFDYGQTSILKRDDDDIGYRLGQYKSDFRTFVDQIISEHQRDTVSTSELQEIVDRYNSAVSKYNALGNQVREFPTNPKNPTQNNSSQIWADSFFYKAPYIYHFVSGDFESARLQDETQANYTATVDSYFKKIVERAVLNNGAAMIQITPENACKIVKFSEVPKEEQTLYTQKKSKLEEFLTKFAAKSIDAANVITKPFKQPIPVSTISPGMEIVLPAGCINPMTGEPLPEIKTKVLDSWQLGGQMMISTDAGVITTRDVTRDIYEVIHNKTSELEYKIAHAAEIEAQKAAEMERINYKLHWFDKIESKIPELPRDDRLDMDDMTYFGYTPELYSQSAAERDRDYQNGMEKFKQKSQVFAQELVQRCLRENIRMIYAGDHWTNFEYYGQTPDDFSPPDFRYNQVPKRYEDEVYLPSTCTDAITGEKLEYNANKMHDIWDIVASGSNSTASFALIGENVNGEIVLVTSIDIRDIARELSKSISMEPQETELENLEPVEPDISDKR